MAYLLSNSCTKNYWNPTTIIEIVVGGWVVSFFCDTVFSVFRKKHPLGFSFITSNQINKFAQKFRHL